MINAYYTDDIKKGENIMALKKCPECGQDVSDKAEKCPHCGYEMNNIHESVQKPEKKKRDPKKYTKLVVVLALLVVGLRLYNSYISEEPTTNEPTTEPSQPNEDEPTQQPTTGGNTQIYQSSYLGIQFTYPTGYEVQLRENDLLLYWFK